jgi:hypothetical protein
MGKLYSSFLQKQSAYEQYMQQQKDEHAGELPDRNKQEPSVPLTARAEPNGTGACVCVRVRVRVRAT